MNPENPISKSPLNALSWVPTVPHPDTAAVPAEEEVERRIQEILNEWFTFYFAGVAFETKTATPATTMLKTFVDCEVLWNQTAMPQHQTKPVIHSALADFTADRCDRRQGYAGYELNVTWNTFIRVASQQASESLPGDNPEAACRRVGLPTQLAPPQFRTGSPLPTRHLTPPGHPRPHPGPGRWLLHAPDRVATPGLHRDARPRHALTWPRNLRTSTPWTSPIRQADSSTASICRKNGEQPTDSGEIHYKAGMVGAIGIHRHRRRDGR